MKGFKIHSFIDSEMSYAESVTKRLRVMLDVVNTGLTAESPTADAPPDSMKIQLRTHQQAVLRGMEIKEQQLLKGCDISGQRLYGDYGVLGDSVGVGKSYMVLGHIARVMREAIPPLVYRTTVHKSSTTHLFSIKTDIFSDLSEAGCLIVVPHTLFRQWADYIKHTHLKSVLIDKAKVMDTGDEQAYLKRVMEAEVVLISNTLYKRFSVWQRDNNIHWKRAFFDEADTIHMIQGYPKPVARFTWFITASWSNILFANETIILPQWILDSTVFNNESPYSVLAPHFTSLMGSSHGAPYRYMRYTMQSYNYFREVLDTNHPLRGHIVLRCDDAYIQESISLPPLYRQQILCRTTLSQQIIGDSVSQEIQNLLHAGDVAGALEGLGIKSEDTTNLIEGVTKTLQKELVRLNQTLAFKASIEYATAASKATALQSLQDKIKHVEDQIAAIRSRIEGFKSQLCPICYDEPGEPTVTPCCSQIFCGQCIISCLVRSKVCPMCRETIHPNRLKKIGGGNQIVEANAEPVDEPDKKPDALLRIIRANPAGRFLVFSRYDNPFTSIEKSMEEDGLTVKQLKGNKDVIASTLNAFEKGKIRCLLLNAGYAGAGLNITAATHVILLHAMKSEEEKQILGRAYRMGRKGPLHFIKLLHADEMQGGALTP